MRIALVTPYSWTYEGGVNRHVESLAEELIARDHHVHVLAPWDPPDRLSRALHRAPATERPQPDYLVSMGRTAGFAANGAVSNLSPSPAGMVRMWRALARGRYDLVHVHEPLAPMLGWDACTYGGAPVVGTFHAYSTKAIPNHIATIAGARRRFNKLAARIAVSEAAAWTGRRWFGGRYEIVPNGVDVEAPPTGVAPASDELRVAFVGRPEERKGLPVLLKAFEALIEHVPARLTVVGATESQVGRYLADPDVSEAIRPLGRVDGSELWRQLWTADVLSAPSLTGESFGMVLTEAFAAGTPVIASEIAGYSEVVSDGRDGILIPPADPQRLAEELQRLHYERPLLQELSRNARQKAHEYAWPNVAAQVEAVYERALEAPEPQGARDRVGRRLGLLPADGGPRRPAERLPSLDPDPQRTGSKHGRLARRLALGVAGVLGVVLTVLAANRIGFDAVVRSAVDSNAALVIAATALMALSMFFRAGSWYVTCRAAMPDRPIRKRDVASATMIGVLMSATLPARLGEPARAMLIARRTGRMRESFPVVLGTIVSQTTVNILALAMLGAIIVATTDLFHSSSERIFLASLAPLAVLLAVVFGPTLVRRNGSGRLARVEQMIRDALVRVRRGLVVFKDPRRGPIAVGAQLTAWGIQLLAAYVLAMAMGLDGMMGVGGAAAVLFAVNVTAVIPATPSNIGVFQLAVISVLTTGYGVGAADALAYGIVLQAVEIATALGLGLPALVREGMTWSDVRLRALSAAPVRLSPRRRSGPEDAAVL
ncbi:MAG: lysylphosphatidylglycerol synthase domain-containing protein [Solirubrobacterales bacterium]